MLNETGVVNSTEVKNTFFIDYCKKGGGKNLTLIINATNDCQLSCVYCYFGKKSKDKMDVEKVFHSAINLSGVFEKLKSVNFHYMGGEPLLAWEEILKLNALAKKFYLEKGVRFKWGITSNLVDLDLEKTNHMIRENANIHCSVDGPADIHDRNRPYRFESTGSFLDVSKNIKLALQITPEDTARITVLPEDVDRIPDIAREVFDLGFKKAGLFPGHGVKWTDNQIDSWGKFVVEAFRIAKEEYEDKSIKTIVNPDLRLDNSEGFRFCGAGRALWSIDVQGKIYLCHHLSTQEKFSIINGSEKNSSQIKKAIENSPIVPSLDLFDGCSKCSAMEYCSGACWSNNFFYEGDSSKPHEELCSLKRSIVNSLKEHFPEALSKRIETSACLFCEECFICVGCITTCADGGESGCCDPHYN